MTDKVFEEPFLSSENVNGNINEPYTINQNTIKDIFKSQSDAKALFLTAKSFLKDKAKKIKLVLTDVDGILTDGTLIYGPDGEFGKKFHARDGIGIKNLLNNNIHVGIISGRHSKACEIRMEELGVNIVYQGINDKMKALSEIKASLKISDEEIAYMGDDIPDAPIMTTVGLSGTVADAHNSIQAIANWKSCSPGGYGAFREFSDFILWAKNL